MKTQLQSLSLPQWLFIPLLLSIFFLMSFCSNERTRKNMNDLKSYVKEHKDSIDRYAERSWDDLDREFTDKKNNVEKDMDHMNAELKQEYNEVIADWESFKADYKARQEEKEYRIHIADLKSSLYPAGVDPERGDILASNILQVYRFFVGKVKMNKDVYTKEEWKAVHEAWKDLNATKDRIEDQLSREAKNEIMKLKLEYAGIKSVNQPFADKP